MRKQKDGFTLIELLMVILIIGLLVVMLLPVVGAVDRAVRISGTEHRIWLLHAALGNYKDTFGDYPPSYAPGNPAWSYPLGWIDDGRSMNLFRPPPLGASHRPPGGMFLAYFLMGPERAGWTPGKHGCNVAWQVPTGLGRMLTEQPVGANDGWRYYFFADSFARKMRGGTIQYARAEVHTRDTATRSRFCDAGPSLRFYALSTWAYRGSMLSYYGLGDGKTNEHILRMARQCPHNVILLSAGVNARFGYYTWDGAHFIADYVEGITDDIANFPLE